MADEIEAPPVGAVEEPLDLIRWPCFHPVCFGDNNILIVQVVSGREDICEDEEREGAEGSFARL